MSEYYEPTIPDQDLQSEENKLVRKALTKLPEPYLSGLKLNADIEINGLTLNTIDDDNVIWVVSDINGWWNLPDSELPDLPRGWGDGSYDAIGRFSNRILTLTGSFLTQSPDQVPAARQKLLNAVNLVKTGGWLIVDEDPTIRKSAYVRLSGAPQISSTRARGRHDFSIGLIANDPIKYEFYDENLDGYRKQSIQANGSGQGVANLINYGNTNVPIVIEIPENFIASTNANALSTITNTDTGEKIEILEDTTSTSTLEIDTYNREVLSVEYSVPLTITNAVGNGTTVTYTISEEFTVSIGEIIEISGITPSSLNFEQKRVASFGDNTITVLGSTTDTYVSGGELIRVDTVENARSKLPVLVDWMTLIPGTNSITLNNFPANCIVNVYYRSGWIG